MERYQKHVEEDASLWEHIRDPREALWIQAYFTYANAFKHRVEQKVQTALEKAESQASGIERRAAFDAYKDFW